MTKDQNKDKTLVLETLKAQSIPISLPELLKILGNNYSDRTVRRWLAEWVKKGVVLKKGEKRGTHYLAIKKTIETTVNKRGVAKGKWDVETKILALTIDSTKTNADEVLKRVADAGYDSEKFKAPDEAYAKLHKCCQYERK